MLSPHFEAFHRDISSLSTPTGLTWLQWNVLADSLAQDGGFVKVPREQLEWDYRFPLICEDIRRAQADVIALQECNHFDDFAAAFGKDYYAFYIPKLTSAASKVDPRVPPDGTCLLVRRSKFDVCGVETIYYTSAEGDEAPGPSSLSNQNGIVALLRQKSTSRFIIAATTHLKAKDGEANAAERKEQAKQMLDAIERMRAKTPNAPVILSGDFNSPPAEAVHGFCVSNGFRSVYNASHETSPPSGEPSFTTFKFRSAEVGESKSPASPAPAPSGAASTPLLHKKRCIDYIFLKNNSSTDDEALRAAAVRALPTVEEVGEAGLPCFNYPSDHLSLCARFEW
jgi:mRNA deadenylase 3'-5' endonuclease subunit Ccr4